MRLGNRRRVLGAVTLILLGWMPDVAFGQGVEVREDERAIRLENEHLAMSFLREQKGAPGSLVDKKSGLDFIAPGAGGALYRLTVVETGRKIAELSSGDAQTVVYKVERGRDAATLHMEAKGHGGRAIDVRVSVTMRAGSPMTSWRLECAGGMSVVNAITVPFIPASRQLGDSPADDHLIWPMCDGLLFTNLMQATLWGKNAVNYPGGASVQFMGLYDDAAGLYMSSQDAHGSPKRISYQLGKNQVDLSVTYFFPETPGPGALVCPETVVGVFHGDWHDAADIYKGWATRQPWCARTTTQRDDIPKWFAAAPQTDAPSNFSRYTRSMRSLFY